MTRKAHIFKGSEKAVMLQSRSILVRVQGAAAPQPFSTIRLRGGEGERKIPALIPQFTMLAQSNSNRVQEVSVRKRETCP